MQFIFTTTWKKWTPIRLEADIKSPMPLKGELKLNKIYQFVVCINDTDLIGKVVITLNLNYIISF